MAEPRQRTSWCVTAALIGGLLFCPLGVERSAPAAEEKYDRARAEYLKAEKAEKDPRRAQRYALLIGDTYRNEKRYDEALKAYERVFTDYPAVSSYWRDAQGRIVLVLRDKGDLPGALRAARTHLDAARDSGGVNDAIRTVIDLLRRADENDVARANAFILYQKYGPAGEDGQAGTQDDPTDPLAKVARASYPRREKAFAAVRGRAGDDATASRYRATTYLYTARPKEALRMYLDAFARCDIEEAGRVGQEMIAGGVRAVRGHLAGLKPFYDFVNYGPAGPDGNTDTADDLRNPFLDLGLSESDLFPQTPGGAAGLTDEDVRTLRQARTLLDEIAASRLERSDVCRSAMAAGLRIRQALCEWKDVQPAEWYLQQLFLRPEDGWHVAAWLSAGQLAAKRGACHLGGVRAFWRRLDTMAAGLDERSRRNLDRRRSAFRRAIAGLENPKPLFPRGLKTLTPRRR